jgi:DNA polymerase-3 subunit chi
MIISFYQLTTGTLEQALAKLLPKVYGQNLRCVIVLPEERLAAVNTSLWTLGHGSFLPHGVMGDASPERQPIWLTTQVENPNDAQVLLLAQGCFDQALATPEGKAFARCLIFFDGHDEAQVTAAQSAWKTYQAASHELIFWGQEKTGEWVKRAGF